MSEQNTYIAWLVAWLVERHSSPEEPVLHLQIIKLATSQTFTTYRI